jgi:outer membrane receptor protein involved in Fe transport
MRARRLPLELRYFAANGWTAALRASIVHQEGEFAVMPSPMSPVMQFAPGEDSFSIVDLSVGYRLPKRRGVLSLNVDNLLDEDLRFQDIDAENPSFAPERMAYLRFTFSFD